jgi:hypothetical protein
MYDSIVGRDLESKRVWSMMNWVSRMIHWHMNGSESILSSKIPDIAVEPMLAKQNGKHGMNIVIRNKILSESGTRWDNVCHKVIDLEKQKYRKRKREPKRFSHCRIYETNVEEYASYEMNVEHTLPTVRKTIPEEQLDFEQPPKMYTIGTSLEEYLEKLDIVIAPDSFEVCQNLTDMIVETAMQTSHEKYNFDQVRNIIDEIIPIIEILESAKEYVSMDVDKEVISNELVSLRTEQQKQYLTWFEESWTSEYASLLDGVEDTATVIQRDVSYDDTVRAIVGTFYNTIDCASTLLNVIVGIQQSIELSYLMYEYESTLNATESLIEAAMNSEINIKSCDNDTNETLQQAVINPVDDEMIQDAIQKLDHVPKKSNPVISHVLSKSPKKFHILIRDIMDKKPTLVIVSQDSITFEITQEERLKSIIKRATLGKLSMNYHSSIVRVIVDYLSATDMSECLERVYDMCSNSNIDLKKFLACCREYGIAILYYLVVPLLEETVQDILVHLAKIPFLLEVDVRDWLEWETYGIDTIKLWYLRYIEEFDVEKPYSSEKNWRSIYIERRVEKFFSDPEGFKNYYCKGKQNKTVIQEEILLWKHDLGQYVLRLDLSKCAITEKDLQVICLTCTELRELILAGMATKISDKMWKDLLLSCKKLQKVRMTNMKISAKTHDRFRRTIPDFIVNL